MKKHWWIVLILAFALAIPAVANQAITIFVDGQELESDVPAQIIDERTMVPARALAEALGKTVDWDGETQTVTITSTGLSGSETMGMIYDEWNASGKVEMDARAAGRDGCASCHDGLVYSTGEFVEDAQVTGIDCQACHSGTGRDAMDSGVVELPFMVDSYQAGLGALCMDCHNGRYGPEGNYNDFAEGNTGGFPHQKATAAITTGAGGMEFEGVTYASTRAHANLNDTCVSCHMTKTENGYIDHTFAMETSSFDEACGSCHAAWGWDEFNSAGLKEKVEANLALLEAAIVEAVGAESVSWGRNTNFTTFVMADESELDFNIENVDIEVYVAAYNFRLISNDPAAYAHNPRYVKSLLDESYKALTGETFDW